MKQLLFVLCGLFMSTTMFAQFTVSSIKLDDKNQSALYFEVNATPDQTEDALNNYFQMMNVEKKKSKDGCTFYKNVKVDKVENSSMDYYVKMEKKKQKGGDGTKIWITSSKGYANFLTEGTPEWGQLKDFADYLNTKIIPVAVSQSNVVSLQKKLKDEQGDLDDILEKKKKSEDNIATINLQIAAAQAEIDRLKTK